MCLLIGYEKEKHLKWIKYHCINAVVGNEPSMQAQIVNWLQQCDRIVSIISTKKLFKWVKPIVNQTAMV